MINEGSTAGVPPALSPPPWRRISSTRSVDIVPIRQDWDIVIQWRAAEQMRGHWTHQARAAWEPVKRVTEYNIFGTGAPTQQFKITSMEMSVFSDSGKRFMGKTG